jgi:hypothetical protein
MFSLSSIKERPLIRNEEAEEDVVGRQLGDVEEEEEEVDNIVGRQSGDNEGTKCWRRRSELEV